jgi:hypothetical protein
MFSAKAMPQRFLADNAKRSGISKFSQGLQLQFGRRAG